MLEEKKSVFVCFIGETNAGKSTLVNAIVDSKVSIVSHKVQTTRFKILGIHTEGFNQIIFIDTPGIFSPKRAFDKEMIDISYSQIEESDIVAIIIDSNKSITDYTKTILSKIPKNKKSIFIFNKVDLISKDKLINMATEISKLHNFDRIFMISALKKKGIKDILLYLESNMINSNWFFDEDQVSDQNLNQMASEITREKIYKYLHQELPYNIIVQHDKWEETDRLIKIYQTIYVVKSSYKGIFLGKGGEKIKQIRVESSEAMSKEFDKKVNLFLFVKVDQKIFDKLIIK